MLVVSELLEPLFSTNTNIQWKIHKPWDFLIIGIMNLTGNKAKITISVRMMLLQFLYFNE